MMFVAKSFWVFRSSLNGRRGKSKQREVTKPTNDPTFKTKTSFLRSFSQNSHKTKKVITVLKFSSSQVFIGIKTSLLAKQKEEDRRERDEQWIEEFVYRLIYGKLDL